MPFAAGSKFHDFTLLSLCGNGGIGEVYLAKDLSGRNIALKIVSKIRFGLAWQRELKGLTHYRTLTASCPGLIPIYHVGEDDHYFYYTMEAADDCGANGIYRASTLEHKQLDVPHTIELGYKLLRGLSVLHEAGLAHRDLKPANVLFVRGEPQIADIGLLSSVNSIETRIAGTLDFLPPEVRSGTRGQIPEDDFYALGKVLYCALTGYSVEQFPSLPPHLKLTPAVKVMNRLFCRSCDPDYHQRLTHAGDFRILLDQAAEQLRHPSHSRLWWADLRQAPWRQFQITLSDLVRGTRKHRLLTALIIVALIAAVSWGYQLYRESLPPQLPEIQATYRFQSPHFNYALTLPREWTDCLEPMRQIISNEEDNDMKSFFKTQANLDAMRELLAEKLDMIFCYIWGESSANIFVSEGEARKYSNSYSPELWRTHIEDLAAKGGFIIKIFDCRKDTIQGYPVFIYEHSATDDIGNLVRPKEEWVDPQISSSMRSCSVALTHDDKILFFTLTAPNKIYDLCKVRFLQAMNTIEILPDPKRGSAETATPAQANSQ